MPCRMGRRHYHLWQFFGDRLRGVNSVGVENCPFPLRKPVAVNTGLALPRSLWQAAAADIIIIMKFISDKMSIETIKKKEKNPRTHTHTIQYLWMRRPVATGIKHTYKHAIQELKLKKNYRDAWLQYFLIGNNNSQTKYDCCEWLCQMMVEIAVLKYQTCYQI